jgi:hypothetical protein
MLIILPLDLLLLPLRLAALAAVLLGRLLAWAVHVTTQAGLPTTDGPAAEDRRRAASTWGP